MTDKFHQDLVATIDAEHGNDSLGQRGDESRYDSGRGFPREYFLAHAKGDRWRGRSDRHATASPSSDGDADEPTAVRS
ncbi:hypothetical protein AB0M54_46640 [Actinoplanes sp. NPDC051470]|uniref:hypothetical protein n=1 Tax=Actinoplanes sp. NPDC051470 TaxID=3157224 RepID=UPI00343A88C0